MDLRRYLKVEIRIFVSEDCSKCGPARQLAEDLGTRGYNVQVFDTSTPDGLAEAAYYSVEETPHVVAENFGEVNSDSKWISEDIRKFVEAAGLLGNFAFVE